MALGPIGQKISAKLHAAFAPMALEVTDESRQHQGHAGARPEGESHFRVRIVAEAFRDRSRVERHRMVHGALAEELKQQVHALAIAASAPAFSNIGANDTKLSALLAAAKLSNADLDEEGTQYIAIRGGAGELVAAGGIKLCGASALLRSIAVDSAFRGCKLGKAIVFGLLETARESGVREIYLLTETAADFFAALGFERISRDRVPGEIAATSQFAGTACASAQAMRST